MGPNQPFNSRPKVALALVQSCVQINKHEMNATDEKN